MTTFKINPFFQLCLTVLPRTAKGSILMFMEAYLFVRQYFLSVFFEFCCFIL